jgi:hypothetical protein
MFHLTSMSRHYRWRQNPDSTSGRFEGRDCDSGVSAFIVDAAPAAGPSAHGFAADAPEGVRLIGIRASARIAQTFVDDHGPLSTACAGGMK